MWQEQWQRVLRAYNWVETYTQTSTPGVPGESTEDRKDRVAQFFQDCYHLKEWLKNDPASETVTADVETELNKSAEMTIVADLANGRKHLKLTRSRSGDFSTTFTRQDIQVTFYESMPGLPEPTQAGGTLQRCMPNPMRKSGTCTTSRRVPSHGGASI